MKTVIIASAALLAVVASPALAQSNYGRDNLSNGYYAQSAQQNVRGAFAQSYPGAFNNPNVVVEGGKVIGADPDANVRLELRRDFESSDY